MDATVAVVAERGLDGFRIGDVAARADVHETSIYRRWGNRQRLLADALLHHGEALLRIPDTGSLRGDMISFTYALTDYLGSPTGAALLRVMALVDGEAMADGRAKLWRSWFDGARVMLDRAVQRGEVREDVDARVVFELLVSPLHFRVLFLREPLDARYAEEVVDNVLRGIAP